MGHQPPRGACPDDPSQAIADLAQAVLPLWGVLGFASHSTSLTGRWWVFHTSSVASVRRKCIRPSSTFGWRSLWMHVLSTLIYSREHLQICCMIQYQKKSGLKGETGLHGHIR